MQELNLILALNSKIGLEVAGTTYIRDNSTVEGFFSRTEMPKFGVLWDINDTLLNAQGLLDAISLSIVNNLPASGHLTGHSLGAWRANNLLRTGHIQSATLLSLPGFAYPAAGSNGSCASMDMICGTRAMTLMRPGTRNVSSPSWWNWLGRNHKICTVSGYQENWEGAC
ncbi:hypothetical protein CWE08_11850 [Aliidiomarina iranensis]|uniref:Uncharacterized protein n=1 Tax=Aliidiomarina iranensis TaxID=1434071 RepID=A0A432VPX2_9GAMM|nr:hypothetical protein [Aliidiomarina iranensis]RUO18172.1 hypothetical protein CWE08_11850 [Aliidiomarina iranensis]